MAFKTPSLREVAQTAPYMHDGSLATLEAVIGHYAGGFVTRPSLATNLNRDLRLSPAERADLVAFLRTLSSGQRKAPPARGGQGPIEFEQGWTPKARLSPPASRTWRSRRRALVVLAGDAAALA